MLGTGGALEEGARPGALRDAVGNARASSLKNYYTRCGGRSSSASPARFTRGPPTAHGAGRQTSRRGAPGAHTHRRRGPPALARICRLDPSAHRDRLGGSPRRARVGFRIRRRAAPRPRGPCRRLANLGTTTATATSSLAPRVSSSTMSRCQPAPTRTTARFSTATRPSCSPSTPTTMSSSGLPMFDGRRETSARTPTCGPLGRRSRRVVTRARNRREHRRGGPRTTPPSRRRARNDAKRAERRERRPPRCDRAIRPPRARRHVARRRGVSPETPGGG